MASPTVSGLCKEERLCGKTTVAALVERGRWGSTAHLKYCWAAAPPDPGHSRIMVSVPKKFFKRAVKRNLLKRRLREAYRTHKTLLQDHPKDIMFVWSSPDIIPFEELCSELVCVLEKLGAR